LDVERDGRQVEIAFAELDDFVDDLTQVDVLRRSGLLAAEPRQVSDDLPGPAALRLHKGDFVSRRRVEIAAPLEQLDRSQDGLQRVVQLVRDARDEDTDSSETLLPDDLTLQRLHGLEHLPFLFELPF